MHHRLKWQWPAENGQLLAVHMYIRRYGLMFVCLLPCQCFTVAMVMWFVSVIAGRSPFFLLFFFFFFFSGHGAYNRTGCSAFGLFLNFTSSVPVVVGGTL